jgi:hypothetical protein
VKDRTIPNELVRAQRSEVGNRVGERNEARFSQSRGHPDHVLFGDPDVEEAIGELFSKRFQRRVTQVRRE